MTSSLFSSRSALLAALALVAGAPAQALTFDGAITHGATVATDYSTTGLVSFDLDLANGAPAELTWRVDDADLGSGGTLAFNAVVRNYTGAGLDGLVFTLSLGDFSQVGSVTRSFGGSTAVAQSVGEVRLSFSPAEFLDLSLGAAPGADLGATDWTLSGLQSGDRFTLSVSAVPEPSTWALMAAGLLGVAGMARRRARG